ncbi:MAG: response regulator transcription factor [Oscillospiraceae bacterium]|nr:response regulator transcription factor [Oscillospiraceae bacterium]
MEYTILVCEDDADIRNALDIYLRQEGYCILHAENGLQAVEIIAKEQIHLILLDVMMPKLDGIAAAVKIRETNNVPILFLSAKSEETDRILGLNMGGDDYITKPFNPIELMARVKAALRRYARLGGLNKVELASQQGIYQTGGLVVDDNKKQVTVDDNNVTLTALEYRLLALLISNQDQVFSSNQIYEAVWDEPAFYVSKTVSVHIRHIREKIEINPKDPQYLKVIYGLGYKVVRHD